MVTVVPLEDLYCILVSYVKDVEVRHMASVFEKCHCCRNKTVKHIICKIIHTPHYKYLITHDSSIYQNYMTDAGIYAGYKEGNDGEHSLDNFNNLVQNFDINKMEVIKCYKFGDKYLISDGVHRVSILRIMNMKEVAIKL